MLGPSGGTLDVAFLLAAALGALAAVFVASRIVLAVSRAQRRARIT